jgi:hypothetical protein
MIKNKQNEMLQCHFGKFNSEIFYHFPIFGILVGAAKFEH